MTEKSGTHTFLITITVMTGAILASLDMSIVNVALPHMKGSLGASVEEITWVSTSYILSTVIIMPLVALLSSRFGRKQFYLFSVILFTGASTLCGFAWDLSSMVTLRIIQGIGGGALIPVAQAILRETYPPEEQGMAMGIYGIGVMLGPAIGPTVGGWITDNYSWPWIFFIKWPLGIITILMVLRYIEDPPFLVREKSKLDLLGIFLLAVGLGALQIMLEKGEQQDWFSSDWIVSLAVASCAGLLLFVWRELTTDKPAVNLAILKDVNFSSATFLSSLLTMALMGILFILPLFLQQLLGYPAMDSGLALLPRSVAMFIVMPIAGRLYNRTGPKWMVGLGFLMMVFSFYQLSRLSLAAGYWDIFLPQFMQGAAFGLIFVSLSTAAMYTIEKRLLTAAAGLYNVMRQIAGSIGIAVAATFLIRSENWNRGLLMEHVTDSTTSPLHAFSGLLFSRGMDQFSAGEGALRMLDEFVMQQASMLSYNRVFFFTSLLFVIATPLVFVLKDTRKFKKPEVS